MKTNSKPSPSSRHQQGGVDPGITTGKTHRGGSHPDPKVSDPDVSPPLALLLRKMDTALQRRASKTPWLSHSTRAQIRTRYAAVLTCESSDVLDFIRWVTCGGRYLATEGNFVSFCAEYLAANEEEARALWVEASPPA